VRQATDDAGEVSSEWSDVGGEEAGEGYDACATCGAMVEVSSAGAGAAGGGGGRRAAEEGIQAGGLAPASGPYILRTLCSKRSSSGPST